MLRIEISAYIESGVVRQGSVGSVGSVVRVGSRRNNCSCIFLCKSATDHSFYGLISNPVKQL
ncbi:hypothetical protein [Okeania sp. SIO2C9]|uniref:hypothetical protein n=1 Tax=Okeania sp. SIO2C9 TaxID=2607791 RepID=UPI0025F6223E|nr:hypothetical protein [Okeania sp. SIO2C9]